MYVHGLAAAVWERPDDCSQASTRARPRGEQALGSTAQKTTSSDHGGRAPGHSCSQACGQRRDFSAERVWNLGDRPQARVRPLIFATHAITLVACTTSCAIGS